MRTKKILIVRLTTLVSILFLLITSCASQSDMREIIGLRGNLGRDITINDVRSNLKGIEELYTKGEIDDIIFMVNDSANGSLADKSYYESVCSNLSQTEIDELYADLSGSSASVTNTPFEPAPESDPPIKPLFNIKILIFVGIGMAAIVITVVLIFVLSSRRKPKNAHPIENVTVKKYDEDYPNKQVTEAAHQEKQDTQQNNMSKNMEVQTKSTAHKQHSGTTSSKSNFEDE